MTVDRVRLSTDLGVRTRGSPIEANSVAALRCCTSRPCELNARTCRVRDMSRSWKPRPSAPGVPSMHAPVACAEPVAHLIDLGGGDHVRCRQRPARQPRRLEIHWPSRDVLARLLERARPQSYVPAIPSRRLWRCRRENRL